jgi:hypothetical protein
VPDRVKKPSSVNPFIPDKPAPPVEPWGFDGDDDDEIAKDTHELAVEAYPEQKLMYDKKTSHDWRQYEITVTAFGHAVIAHEEDWEAYNTYKKLHEERRVKEIVTVWRYDTYTPTLCSAGGPDLFGPAIREEHYPDSIIEAGKMGDKKKRMCITKETDAYGLLQYENCRSRWEAIFEHEAQFPGVPVPHYNVNQPTTHAFRAKWSDDGQGSGSGWGTEAYIALDDWERAIEFWREEEKRTGYKRWGATQASCKKLHAAEDGEEDGDNEEDE